MPSRHAQVPATPFTNRHLGRIVRRKVKSHSRQAPTPAAVDPNVANETVAAPEVPNESFATPNPGRARQPPGAQLSRTVGYGEGGVTETRYSTAVSVVFR